MIGTILTSDAADELVRQTIMSHLKTTSAIRLAMTCKTLLVDESISLCIVERLEASLGVMMRLKELERRVYDNEIAHMVGRVAYHHKLLLKVVLPKYWTSRLRFSRTMRRSTMVRILFVFDCIARLNS